MTNGEFPCNVCAGSNCSDCVWDTFPNKNCSRIECQYEYEGSCTLGFDDICGFSTEYEEEDEND